MKKHLPLIIGIALPLIFIIVISIAIFTPSLFIKPAYDFIYTNADGYYYGYNQQYKNTLKIENGRIELDPVTLRENETYAKEAPSIYIYDVETNTSREITIEDARRYSVDPGPSSPDGYTVAYNYGNYGIFELFGSNGNDSGYFISKGNGKKKLSGLVNDRYGAGAFKLLGWVK